MARRKHFLLATLTLGFAPLILEAAGSYQPSSNVTRGIYARMDSAVGTCVWQSWGGGFRFVDSQAHEGQSCIRCEGHAGEPGQGVRQRIELGQAEPRPVKIAGWSRAEAVSGDRSYRYSLYVDFVFTDGQSWPMKLASALTGSP